MQKREKQIHHQGAKGTTKDALSLWFLCAFVPLWLSLPGCDSKPHTIAKPASPPLLIHVPGIGGHMRIDDNLLAGLKQGGLDADMQIFDWTGEDRGLVALGSTGRHDAESTKLAELIIDARRADPSRPIIITCHSAGAGIVIWALEKLPVEVRINTLLMLQPALSPTYALTRALLHVSGEAFVFYSEHDPVLGPGTRMLGTVDRVKTEAAGRVGFSGTYPKLTQFKYDPGWMRIGNPGDHIGPMRRRFAAQMLVPLIKTGKLPPVPAPTTTRAAA